MTSRDTLVERAAPFLPPGAEVRQAFIGQAAANWAYIVITYFTGLTMFWIKYRCIVVTSDGIYVLESSKPAGGAKPIALLVTLPRQTRLGPATGRWATVKLNGEALWVHKRFHPDIAAADREAGFESK